MASFEAELTRPLRGLGRGGCSGDLQGAADVLLGAGAFDDRDDLAPCIENEGDPSGESEKPEDAIPASHLLPIVRQQRKVEGAALREPLLLAHRIDADAQDHRVLGSKLGQGPLKLPSFDRAAQGVGLWIEVEDDVLPSKLRESDRTAVRGRQGEIGGGISYAEHRGNSERGGITIAPPPDWGRRAAMIRGGGSTPALEKRVERSQRRGEL